MATKRYLKNTQTEAGTTGTPSAIGAVVDLSTTQGSSTTLDSGNLAGSATYDTVPAKSWTMTVGASVIADGTQDYDYSWQVTASTDELFAKPRLRRVNSSGVTQATSGFGTEVSSGGGDIVGIHTGSISFNAGTWAAGDRIVFDIHAYDDGPGPQTITFAVNDADSWVETVDAAGGTVTASAAVSVGATTCAGVGDYNSLSNGSAAVSIAPVTAAGVGDYNSLSNGSAAVTVGEASCTGFTTNAPATIQASSISLETSDTTTHDVIIPTGTIAGDTMMLFIGIDGTPTISSGLSGWTQVGTRVSSGTTFSLDVYRRIADGSETDFTYTTNAAERSVNIVLTIVNVTATTPTFASDNDTDDEVNPPPSGTTPWALKPNLFLVATLNEVDVLDAPVNYTLERQGTTLDVDLGVSYRHLTATSDDPDSVFLSQPDPWAAVTIALEPVSSTYTGSSGVTIAPVTASGSGEYPNTAAAAVSAGAATCSGSATFAGVTYTASAAVAMGAATAAGAADYDSESNGSAAVSMGAATCSGAADYDSESNGSAAVSMGAATCSGSATFTSPVYTASAAVSMGAATAAGAADYDSESNGSAAVSAGAATCSGVGDYNSLSNGAAAVSMGAATCSGAAFTGTPTFTADAAVSIGAATASGVGDYNSASDGTAAVSVGAATCSGSATYVSESIGDAAVSIGSVTCSGSAFTGTPTFTASSAVSIAPVTAAGVGDYNSESDGTAAVSMGAATCSGSAQYQSESNGTAAVSVGAATCAGVANTGTPTFTASSAVSIAAVTCAGVGDYDSEGAASAAVTIGAVICSGSGTAESFNTGAAAVAVGAATCAGVGDYDSESNGTIAVSVGPVVCSGVATFESFHTATSGVTVGEAFCVGVANYDSESNGTIAVTIGAATCALIGFRDRPMAIGAVVAPRAFCVGFAHYTPRTISEEIQSRNEFFDNINRYRGLPSIGSQGNWALERSGGQPMQVTAFEPAASTHRGNYYYNTATNTLYRKVVTARGPGYVVAHWRQVSE